MLDRHFVEHRVGVNCVTNFADDFYLNNTMIFVMGQTVGTERVTTAVQAIHVAFAFISISMETTSGKVISS